MNNETIILLTRLCEILEEPWTEKSPADAIRDLIREENPDHTCATKPWDWDSRNPENPIKVEFTGTFEGWKTFHCHGIPLDPFATSTK